MSIKAREKLNGVSLFCCRILILMMAGCQSDRDSHSTEPAGKYTIAGLPDRVYTFDVNYANGSLEEVDMAGTKGFVIKPKGAIDRQRRWVWISPMYLGINSTEQGKMPHRYYVEGLLKHGFYVAGIDIGVSCGSPKGVEIYQKFYKKMVGQYRLNHRAIFIAQSNGGLRVYAWAFRHPKCVDRIFGIMPATDMRDWPGLNHVVGQESYVPKGVGYDISLDELKARLSQFNPIDNIEPLAKSKVKILHVHGDKDDLVRIVPNSIEFGKRYHSLGGEFELLTIKGGGHDACQPFYQCKRGLEFLLE